MLIYLIVIIIINDNRSTPLYGSSRNGLRLFSGQNRDQYVLEGIIIALFTIGAAMSLVLMNYTTKIKYSILRHIGVLFCLSLFLVLSLQLWNAYVDKTRWYSLKETIPEQIWSWLSSSVKKNSSLPKRLLRISEFWLFEYKDWEGFLKKIKVLVIDYISRTYFGYSQSSTNK